METRICTTCQKELPATSEFFYMVYGKPYSKCKECEKKRLQKYKKELFKSGKKIPLSYTKEYRQNNAHKARCKKLGLEATLSAKEWLKTLDYFYNACAYCGSTRNIELDHLYPVCRGGNHTKDNVVPACSSCNSLKSSKLWMEWYLTSRVFDPQRAMKILLLIQINMKKNLKKR